MADFLVGFGPFLLVAYLGLMLARRCARLVITPRRAAAHTDRP
jgi:hypothetical protein